MGEVRQYFQDLDSINPARPCCLYTGQLGFEWAQAGCNALEHTSQITQITDMVGPGCEGCPQIAPCPGVRFPTMFWETASWNWANMIATAPRCNQEIYMLVPGLRALTLGTVEVKISFRIELNGINDRRKIFLVTNEGCNDLF